MTTPVHTQLFIDGAWAEGVDGRHIDVRDPATGRVVGTASHAGRPDLVRAVEAVGRGFEIWRRISAFERAKLMRRAADAMRTRVESIARTLTTEEGKPLAEARAEILGASDMIDWFAEEARRTYGRVIPARSEGVYQLTLKEPVGPVAAFSPWNFPISLSVRKIAAALAAGCSVILKCAEETPAACSEVVRVFEESGLPPGVLNLVFGTPAEISEFLIPHPVIRKVSFTGSTAVGRELAALAGKYIKRISLELGGHAPVVVFDDADVDAAAKSLVALKYRNAGQVCIAPTRFLVQRRVYDRFVATFIEATAAIKVGSGLEPDTTMGPLAHERRLAAVGGLVADAVENGAEIQIGGDRIGSEGFFFAPTVLTSASSASRVMNEEPFGPVAAIARFDGFDEAVQEANRLPYGLAAFAYTKSTRTATMIAAAIESGMVTINHHGFALPEVPFGGVKDSGYGSEGGAEAIESYLVSKFVSQAGI
jgi:succinate-semialdehyde dehydrogenase / glutarate-semialdehyde dehydrogenase